MRLYRGKGAVNVSQNIHRPVDWEQLVNENENRLYRAALAILGDGHEAEDAVQDAFVRYLEKAPAQLENSAAWLMRVLVNGCKSRLRRAWRQELPLWDAIPAPEPEEQPVLDAVLALPPMDRAVIHLFYYEGYSTGEIARITGQPPGTVRSRLSRARGKLRGLLSEQDFPDRKKE